MGVHRRIFCSIPRDACGCRYPGDVCGGRRAVRPQVMLLAVRRCDAPRFLHTPFDAVMSIPNFKSCVVTGPEMYPEEALSYIR